VLKVLSVFGTRPEAIKMAPLIKKLQENSEVESTVAVTAQHREMLDMVLELFKIVPDYDLNIMKKGQTLTHITARVLEGMGEVLKDSRPDIVLVHGDTTTTFAASLAGFYLKIPVGHVEAGLRTANKYSPYPEEINRRLTGNLADLHFAPTAAARENLLKENVRDNNICVTGNTVIDALLSTVDENYSFDENLGFVNETENKIILVTAHRRENWGKPMDRIFNAVKEIVNNNRDVEIVFPVHKNPKVRNHVHEILGSSERVHLIEPLDYRPFVNLMDSSYFILTDSGGMQEEAPSLGKPVLVLRDTTERPEAVSAGTVKLVGTEKEEILNTAQILLNDRESYLKMANAVNPYGDGRASDRIVDALLTWKQKV
jgi:UDP-N-acetylglucosamine 2-epimerase (non-hydrolysing)